MAAASTTAGGKNLPRIMHWISWCAAMALNRLRGRCGHLWEARYYSTPIDPAARRRVLATLRYIHPNTKAAGVRKGFHDPYSNYGHYERLEGDGLSEWHLAYLQVAPTLEGCARRYAHYCHSAVKGPTAHAAEGPNGPARCQVSNYRIKRRLWWRRRWCFY
jgi:putative transposase